MGFFLKTDVKSFLFVGLVLVLGTGRGFAQDRRNGVSPEIVAEHRSPIDVTGDQTIYDSNNDSFTVRGHAVMTQGDTVLYADELIVMRKQRRAAAIGHVHLTDPEVEMWASKARVNLDRETLELDDAKILAKRKTYHLEGKKISKLPGQRYAVVKGFFTTCGDATPDWSISAERMDVSMGSSGHARNAKFAVLGYPLIPIPYLEFPADTDRHSGFLSGREGESGLRGFQYLQPYYLVINKSSDATAALDVESSQRVGGLGEYRLTNGEDDYLWMDGAFYDESIRSAQNRLDDIVDNQIADPHIPIDRYGFIAMARQHVSPGVILYGDAVSVSDPFYLREMDVWTLSRGFGISSFGSMRDAVSHFGLVDEFDNGFLRVQGTWSQDLIQDQQFALQQLPDVWASGRRRLFGDLAYLDYDFDAVDYWRELGQNGLRFNLNPRVTVPWRWGDYVYGYATFGGYGTVYETSGDFVNIIPVGTQGLDYNNALAQGPLAPGGFQSRWLPYGQAGLSTVLEKVYDVNWGPIEKLKHTLEPFVNYSYVPSVYQDDLPLFDEYDRIEARSLITYGITSRLFARMSQSASETFPYEENPNAGPGAVTSALTEGPYGGLGEEASLPTRPLEARSGRSTVRELASLTVMGAYDTNHPISPAGLSLSDLSTALMLYPNNLVSLGSIVGYDPRSHPGLSYAQISMSFQPPWTQNTAPLYMGRALVGSFLQVSYNYIRPESVVEKSLARNASSFVSVSSYYDISDRLGIYLGPNYSFAASRLLSAEWGFRLKAPCNCWAVDTGLSQSFNPNEVRFQVQLTLGGLGSIGQTPFGRNPFYMMGLMAGPGGRLPLY